MLIAQLNVVYLLRCRPYGNLHLFFFFCCLASQYLKAASPPLRYLASVVTFTAHKGTVHIRSYRWLFKWRNKTFDASGRFILTSIRGSVHGSHEGGSEDIWGYLGKIRGSRPCFKDLRIRDSNEKAYYKVARCCYRCRNYTHKCLLENWHFYNFHVN